MKKGFGLFFLCFMYMVSFSQNKKTDIAIIPEPVSIVENAGRFILPQNIVIEAPAQPQLKQTEAFSLAVEVEGQEEVDYYWNALTANGGEESMCGWLKDKFGLSWQITPKELYQLMDDPNPAKSQAVWQAMLKMKKIIVADLKKAYDSA